MYDGEKDRDPVLPWTILLCRSSSYACPEPHERVLLANMLYGLVNFASIDCDANKKLCAKLTGGSEDAEMGAYHFESTRKISDGDGKRLQNSEFRALADEILEVLPDVPTLDEEQYSKVG